MKTSGLFQSYACFALLTFLSICPCPATVITFDDISARAIDPPKAITNGYQGLNWVNFFVEDVPLEVSSYGTNGYYYGMVSPSNVAFNSFGDPAEIDSSGSNFNFLSIYLTGAWNSNLNIDVQGFSGTNLLYDQTVVVSATNPTLFTFNYLDIDRLYFNSFGGQSAGFPGGGGGEQFAMDNLTVEFVPEPSSLLLATGGALLLWPLLKRKRMALARRLP